MTPCYVFELLYDLLTTPRFKSMRWPHSYAYDSAIVVPRTSPINNTLRTWRGGVGGLSSHVPVTLGGGRVGKGGGKLGVAEDSTFNPQIPRPIRGVLPRTFRNSL